MIIHIHQRIFIYNVADYGTHTCERYPGSIDYIPQDMQVCAVVNIISHIFHQRMAFPCIVIINLFIIVPYLRMIIYNLMMEFS